MYNKIFITGGTGFIGKEIVNLLKGNRKYQCYVLTRKRLADSDNIHYICGDIFDDSLIKNSISDILPDILLHLAWNVQDENFSSSDENLLWYKKSVQLSKCFLEYGGKAIIAAGTCFEYDMTNIEKLSEDSTCNPQSLYGKCKVAVYNELRNLCRNYQARLVWGRIFYPYGPEEEKRKLIATAFASFKSDSSFVCKTPENIIDYIYVKDVAEMFYRFIEDKSISDVVNVCTGEGIKIKDLLKIIENLSNKNGFLEINDIGQRKYIVGSVHKLRKYNLIYKVSLLDGLKTYM